MQMRSIKCEYPSHLLVHFSNFSKTDTGHHEALRRIIGVGGYFLSIPAYLSQNISVYEQSIDGIMCKWVSPRSAVTNNVILFCHGGGFAFCSSNTHMNMLSGLYHSRLLAFLLLFSVISSGFAQRTNFAVCSIDYGLSPTRPHPCALFDVCRAYFGLLRRGHNARDISFLGAWPLPSKLLFDACCKETVRAVAYCCHYWSCLGIAKLPFLRVLYWYHRTTPSLLLGVWVEYIFLTRIPTPLFTAGLTWRSHRPRSSATQTRTT